MSEEEVIDTPKEETPKPKAKPRWGGAPSVKCIKCAKTVYPAEKVSMDKKIFHINCFRCQECNKKLGGANWGGFVPPEDNPYCKNCHRKLLQASGSAVNFSGSTTNWKPKEKKEGDPDTPTSSRFGGGEIIKCPKCDKRIYTAEMVVMDKVKWHQNCFRCKECNKMISGANWGGYVDEEPFCKNCHKKLLAKSGSSAGFSGSSTTWKPKEKAPEDPDKPKKKSRWGGAPSTKCVKCGKTVYNAEMITMEKKIFHIKCLRCVDCNKMLTGANWGAFLPPNDDSYCNNCLKKKIAAVGNSTALTGSTAGNSKWDISQS